ncbi:unnamed protein product [Penicillium salamii]|uniref:Uncharacterized protein n=1 Tax=Penicillium salamii TaxID=1612424 RepID=A0A9W4IMJ9_9EURO|nr:unnamed protein product [Penicillium salamii]CAG8010633.1 unnamed protein product [Penicillium salamii]CAG8068126.1 unnamed protein product [Penicillium salamii]CAG8251748.1 unnamed protein product [Penicillium salamii]CAG8310618.1 unnamed protein product [Penicillium salamii]
MAALCRRHQGLFDVLISHPRLDLISYAVVYWPIHFHLTGPTKPIKEVCTFLSDRTVSAPWSEAFRVLLNPITRLNRCYLSPLPLASMCGLDEVISSLLEDLKDTETFQRDCQLALTEAARHGHIRIAHKLLKTIDIDNPTLADAMTAAGCCGAGSLLLDLVTLASQKHDFKWPSGLLLRVSETGGHEIAKILLDVGMPVNDMCLQGHSTLHSAAIFNNEEIVRLLLAKDADVSHACASRNGRTALASASLAPTSRAIIKMLMDAGSDLNQIDLSGCTPLNHALICGNLSAVEEMLENKADIEIGGVEEDTLYWCTKPLIHCAYLNELEGIRVLLRYSPDIDCCWGQRTPLWIAVNRGNIEIAKLLLESGANPNLNPQGLDMILLRAVEHPTVELVKLLLDYGADIEQEDNSSAWRSTALARVAGTSNTDILRHLLERQPKVDVGHIGKNSQSPLHVAAQSGQTMNLRILLQQGSDPNAWSDDDSWLPLHASFESTDIIKLLLAQGCNINAKSAWGSILNLAVFNEQIDSVELLLEQNPKPDLELEDPSVAFFDESDKGVAPLAMACAKNNAKIVRLLIEAGADTHHRTRFGTLPLDIAVASDAMSALKVLLEYRVSVNHLDNDHNTVLHRITKSTPRAIVRQLVNSGASVTAVNKKGVTPIQATVKASNFPVAEFLLSRGAKPNQFGPRYHSLLHIACDNCDLPTLKALVEAGADVQRADTLNEGPTLMHSLLYGWESSGLGLLADALAYLIEECKVNKDGIGGLGDLPLVTACFFQLVDQIRYLLEHETNPNLEDSSGRRALHVAASGDESDMVDLLLEFKAEVFCGDEPIIDKLGRTCIHFAAVGANWEIFQRFHQLYGEKELHRPDCYGWTPLFWALLTRNASINIVQCLVDHGADLWMTAKGLTSEWSPLKLARYIGLSDEIQELLVPKSRIRQIGPGGKVKEWDEEAHLSRRATFREYIWCDSCRVVGHFFYSSFLFRPVTNLIASVSLA